MIAKLNISSAFIRFLFAPRVVRVATLIGFLVRFITYLVAGTIAAYWGAQGYNILYNVISDLGRLKYTPFPWILQVGDILSTILLLPIGVYLHVSFQQPTQGQKGLTRCRWIGYASYLISWVGSMGTGAITLDLSVPVHNVFAALMIFGLLFAGICYGILVLKTPTSISRSLGWYLVSVPPAMVAMFIWFYFLTPFDVLFKEFFEWLVFFAISFWMITISVMSLKRGILKDSIHPKA